MANKDTSRTQQSTDLNQDRKSPGMNQSQGQDLNRDRQQSQDRSQDRQQSETDKSSARIDQDRKDV